MRQSEGRFRRSKCRHQLQPIAWSLVGFGEGNWAGNTKRVREREVGRLISEIDRQLESRGKKKVRGGYLINSIEWR